MLQRAGEARVDCIINPGSDLESCYRAQRLAEEYEQVYHAAGLHPHYAKDIGSDQWDAFVRIAREGNPVAIGETGLDYHYDFSPREAQQHLFRKQVSFTLELGLPIIVHCREAYDDCLKILAGEAPGAQWRGVMHCFTGTPDDARAFLARGFFVSFAGMITFRNADALRETAAAVPVERLLLETDSPYLAPQPVRGKRNEPANVAYIARVLADIHGAGVEDIARTTSANARALFGIAAPSSAKSGAT